MEGGIILGHMPIPEYNSFLVSLKVCATLLQLQVDPAMSTPLMVQFAAAAFALAHPFIVLPPL